MPVGSCAKFAQNPVMLSHLMDTGDRLLAEGSPYDLIWRIGCMADNVSAGQPPLWLGLNLPGSTLQPCNASSATARRRRRATNFCLLRAVRPPVDSASAATGERGYHSVVLASFM